MQDKIAIVGQGYVGLPLAMAAANAGFCVVGVDNNSNKVLNLNNFISNIEGVGSGELEKIISEGSYFATEDFSKLADSEIILICVPTPLGKDKKPDLKYLIEATTEVAKNMPKGALIIIESTVAPGTTRNLILP